MNQNNKFISLIAVFFWLISASLSSQASLSIHSDDFSQSVTYFDILHEGDLSLAEVQSPQKQHLFAPWNILRQKLPRNSTIWLKFSVRNTQMHDTNMVLHILHNLSPPPEIFISPHDNIEGHHGSHIQSSLTYQKRALHFSLLAGEQRELYIKVQTNQAPRMSFMLENPSAAVSNSQLAMLGFGILAGISLFLIALSLYLYRVHRSQDFLILSALPIIYLFIELSWAGIPASIWQSFTTPRLDFSHGLVLLAYSAFISLFMNTMTVRGQHTQLRTSLMILIALNVTLAFAKMANIWVFSDLPFHILCIINVLILTLSCITRLYEGDSFAGRWIAVMTPLFILQITNDLTSLFILPLHPGFLGGLHLLASIFAITSLTFMRIPARQAAISTSAFSSPDEPEPAPPATFQLSSLGHELRTPMNGIMGMTELLLNTNPSHRQAEYLRTLQLSGHELLTLINQTVDASKILNDKITPTQDRIDSDELLHQCVERFNYRAYQLGLELALLSKIDPETDLLGDTSRINRTLNALMLHAINHMEQGSILLTANLHTSPANASAQIRSPLVVRFTITSTDGGVGSEAARKDLNRQDNSDSPLNILSMTRDIIQFLGGAIGTTETTDGSMYWFDLPVQKTEKHHSHASALDHIALADKRVLVVDDNDTCRTVLVQQLQKHGLHVDPARDATEAMALLRTEAMLGRPYDAIFLDHQMPGINGLQLAERLRQDSLFTNLITIMLTGLNLPKSEEAYAKGFITRILTKPASGKRIRETLQDALLEANKEKESQTEPLGSV
ncbi:response regulator [Parendozoicomonas haliclonae]|uniref:response regulator n=1 Tax=Parendozoicomonas haliclonae TaxID=1960125 RepID=UPI0013FD312C|nr:response regulator [Parendozoicomonas haliclonae]